MSTGSSIAAQSYVARQVMEKCLEMSLKQDDLSQTGRQIVFFFFHLTSFLTLEMCAFCHISKTNRIESCLSLLRYNGDTNLNY